MKPVHGLAIAVAALFCILAAAVPASASFPGENGRIFFQSNRGGPPEIYSMNPDGSDVRRLTWNNVPDQMPRVSADGTRIVFARTVAGNDVDIWIMNADGTAERQLTSGAFRDDHPVFTHDGEHVVFQRIVAPVVCPCELRIVGIDGAGERVLDTGPGNAANPDVSKNGKLAFAGDAHGARSIYVTDLRGGPVTRVTSGPAAFGDVRPRWSPRGNDIVFMRDDAGSLATLDLWRVHKDGTELRRLTNAARVEEHPQWSPDGERILFSVLDAVPPFGGRLHTVDADDGSDEQVLPRFAVPFADAFEDGRIDGSFWSTGVSGTETSIAETNGRIEVAVGAGAVPGGPFNAIDGQQFLRCGAPGDFDVGVDYELLDWPAANGVQVALSAHFTGGTFVWRESNPFGEFYVGITPSAGTAVVTDDLAGRLRLVRENGIASAMVQDDSGWRVLASSPSIGMATFSVQASSFPGRFAGRPVRVAFDDFRLNASELTCPPFWRDAAADWAAAS